ncbi:hypothetical protein J2X19_001756 [Rhodoferax ferrireducens]|uniref:Late embryogenesis abundant protein LEA-2 subgroup domain-containing protein n=1 Tax=Rhodoferax ferrireducens TaxID=192843 RepID=A0ABU2C6Y2_9BURK|nr:hypothetical protein [Rhodoferax ferrireducens]MDR7377098.1 hypothetical protein [Rhodoferax ferrireducens]
MASSFRTIFKEWLEIVAVLVAAGWALWTFYFAEVLKPEQTRGYLQLVLDVTKAGAPHVIEGTAFLPIKIDVRATNPTKRKLEVSSAYVEVYGDRFVKTGDD